MLDLSFNRAETLNSPCHTLFGKLPNRADFVRVNANHPVAREFDGLIQRAMGRLDGVFTASSGTAQAGVVDFQYLSRDQRHLMVGALIPSKDQAGRQYPLIGAAILPYETLEIHVPVLPIAFEVFFEGLREQLVNAVENSVEALSCRQFLETSLRSFDSAAGGDLQLARSVVERFMSDQPARRLATLLANENTAATLQQALLNIAFYQAHLRRFDNRSTNQLLLLPLGAAKGEQALLASVWLSLLSALWANSADTWRCSCLVFRRPGETAQLVSSIGSLPDSFGAVTLGAPIESSMALDLSQAYEAWMSHRMYAETSYALGRFLADPELRVTDLHRFLVDISRQLAGNF